MGALQESLQCRENVIIFGIEALFSLLRSITAHLQLLSSEILEVWNDMCGEKPG